MTDWKVITGDCVEVMSRGTENAIDAIVTDPPYGLKFMGKGWDDMGDGKQQEEWHRRWAVEAYRVLKPGGHLLAFGGTRTYHRLASAVEDAGFEIRDQMQWLYGTGFPKSHNISKAIDKAAGAQRNVVERAKGAATQDTESLGKFNAEYDKTESATPEAVEWEGWGTALKPAHEPIVVARKPFKGTVAANVLEHGTGGINIDASRVGQEERPRMVRTETVVAASSMSGESTGATNSGEVTTQGRWPANVILDEQAGAILDEQSGHSNSAGHTVSGRGYGNLKGGVARVSPRDEGGASRFFYCAKASKAEREAGLQPPEDGKRANTHPTVKPAALMAYLVRLVTPPGGTVLDPFNGSGSTGIATVQEGFNYIGIELDPDHAELARTRISHALDLTRV